MILEQGRHLKYCIEKLQMLLLPSMNLRHIGLCWKMMRRSWQEIETQIGILVVTREI
jgi:hypothetical protein